MAIKVVEDQINGGTVTMVEGVIQQISFRELENDRFQNTHRAGIKIDDVWVNNINIKTKEGFEPSLRINAGDRSSPNWVNIEQGDEVRIIVKPNEWNGKTYYNAGVSGIRLIKKGSGTPQQSNSTNSGAGTKTTLKKRDNTGVVAGNARTASANWAARFGGDIEDYLEMFVGLADAWRKQYAEDNSDLDDFEVGVTVGQAVLAASQLAEEKDFDVFIAHYLGTVVPKSISLVKDGVESNPKKTTTAKKATKKVEAPVEVAEDGGFDDMDESFPF